MVPIPPKALIRALVLGFFLSVGFPPAAAHAVCGDGIFDAGETCDDLNVAAGDGCDASCAIEAGFACVGEPSECGTLLSLDLVGGSGDSLVTRDELTDLEWLDVSETLGRSFDAVEASPTGPLANGWRAAESAEVCTLLGRYALAPAICPEPNEAVTPADIASFVHTLLGRTDGGTPADPSLDASFDDALTGSDGVFRGRALLELRSAGTSTASLISDDQVDPLVASPSASHLLVRVAGPCGDLDLNGAVEFADADALRTHLADPAGSSFGATEFDRCTVVGAQRPCDTRDVAAMLRALDPSVSERSLDQNCAAAIGATTCGDSSIEPGETCDDGLAVGGDGCSEFCEIEPGFECADEPSGCNLICSNGVLNGIETCDDTNLTPGDGCGADCQTEPGFSCSGEPSTCSFVCGDGIIDPNEPCDDGNLNSGDGCSNVCSLETGFNCSGEPSVCAETCGDGVVVGIETCDDGATTGGDGCDASCQVEAGFSCSGAPSSCVTTCGDSVIAGIEQCDDGNQSSFDGCSGTCSVEPGTTCTGQPSNCVFSCGNGALSGSEECDDSNLTPGDGCSATCRVESGFSCSGEPSTCTPLGCGDGLLQGAEVCDDGNTNPGDGCDDSCLIETGFVCNGEPSSCNTVCGDGIPAGLEACDDGNLIALDGCDDLCAVETDYTCYGAPSVCLNVSHSFAVNDAAVIAAGDFSFSRTVQAVIDSSGGTATTAVDFVQTFIDTFTVTSHTQPESGLEMPVDLRAGEAAMDPNDLLDPAADDGLVPVALFNRFDLAPADGSHCGEHRIVYARQGPGVGFPRLTVIFEAALPNPTPVLGLEGCRPVAEFWASLSDETAFPSAASRATALENFYYTGLPGFDAVVTHAAYGVPLGQVRADIFMTGLWQLREFRTFFAAGGEAILVAGTTASSPLVEYYDSNFDVTTAPGFAGVTDSVLFGTERTAFQTDLLDNRVSEVLGQELGAAPLTAFDLINRSSVSIPSRFWEFQVGSQPPFSDEPQTTSSVDLNNAIDAELTTLGVTELNAQHVLNRIGAMTCGGCHEFSVDRVIGKTEAGLDVLWPESNQFTHVDEQGELSPALTDFFLPFRRDIMGGFLATPSGGSSTAPAALRLPLARTKLKATRAQRDFELALDDFYKCEDAGDMPRILEALDLMIDKVRWEDSVKPGAFYDIRRTH